MPSTDLAYGATLRGYAIFGTEVAYGATLRGYAIFGTEGAYGATLRGYAIFGTEVAYGATLYMPTGSSVLRQRVVLRSTCLRDLRY
eukprot:3845589-Rhodomonas_salina.1